MELQLECSLNRNPFKIINVPRMDHIDREKNVASTVNAEVITRVRL